MKISNAFLLAGAMAGLASAAHAAPVKYVFTGTQINEQYQDYSTVPTIKNVFTNGTAVSVSFFYDSSAPATATNFPAASAGGFNNFGNMSKYDNSATQFFGTIMGRQFSATAGRTLVSNATPAQSGYRDGVFLSSGTPDLNFAPIAGSNFQGFQTGQFTLVGLNLWKVGPNSYLSNQSLPNSLTSTTVTDGLYLTFVDANHQQQYAQFLGTFTLAPVPVPAAAWLFGSGLLGLAGTRMRRAKTV